MTEARKNEEEKNKRLRLLYSLGDFQLSLSAAAFLADCEPDRGYSKVDLRRFRCYETAMITSYVRPFSQSKGEIPSLSLKMSGAVLTDRDLKLHAEAVQFRNKIVAHSDAEMMRMLVAAHPIELDDDFTFVAIETVFDEGIHYSGLKLAYFSDLISKVHGSILQKLLRDAQNKPQEYGFRKDHLNP